MIGRETPIIPGDVIIYAISYSNNGNQGASGVFLSATLPSYTTFDLGSSTVDWQREGSSNQYRLNIGGLIAGDSGNATFAVKLDNAVPAGYGAVDFSISIGDDGANGADPTLANNTASGSTPVEASPGLSVDQFADKASLIPGQTLIYTITTTNNGSRGASGVSVFETLPTNTLFQPGSSTSGWELIGGDQYRITLGIIESGESVPVNFAIQLNNSVPAGLSQITNSITVSDDGNNGIDPNTTNNTAIQNTAVTAEPDLVIVKSDGDTGITPGGTVSYTLAFQNSGNQDAAGVIIYETLPANTSFNSIVSTSGWQRVGSTSQYTYSKGNLSAGQQASVVFAVKVNNPVPGGVQLITNSASIDDDHGNGTDPVPSNNTSTDTTPIITAPEFSISQSGPTANPTPGDIVIYTINFQNNGNIGASGVLLTDTLPAHTAFHSANSSTGWSQIGSTDQYAFSVGNLAVGQQQTVYFAVTVVSTLPTGIDTLSNQVVISDDLANGNDPNLTNNSSTLVITVDAAPDLSLTKTDHDVSIYPGQTVVYTLAYNNIGNQDASGVTIIETLPANSNFVAAQSGQGWQPGGSSGEYVLNLNSLVAGVSGETTFAVSVSQLWPDDIESIANSAVISDDGTNGSDLNPANNTGSDSTPVLIGPDLSLLMSAEPTTLTPGGVTVYTITYANAMRKAGIGVIITETLPENTTFVAGASSVGWVQVGITNQYTFSIGTVNTGQTGDIQFAIQVGTTVSDGLELIENTASIEDNGVSGPDPNSGNNTATASVAVDAAPDLIVTQNDGDLAVQPGGRVTYQINVRNAGNQAANGVILIAQPIANTTFDAVNSSAEWTYSSGSYQLNAVQLNAGDSKRICVRCNLAEYNSRRFEFDHKHSYR